MKKRKPLLSIAIPTYNRALYLKRCLEQIFSERQGLNPSLIEIIVSDNASSDHTEHVVRSLIEKGLEIRYIQNQENKGSDLNIAQCFNLARGHYVLIMGDDDLFVDGGLQELLLRLESFEYGIVSMRSYGFDKDFREERPSFSGACKVYTKAGDYLLKIFPYITFISACVIHKSIIHHVNADRFVGGNLVQVHLCMMAMLRSKKNLFIGRYMIAAKRNNSGGYEHASVFLSNLLSVIESFVGRGISIKDVENIERKLIVFYFPFYIFKSRLKGVDLWNAQKKFSDRFERRLLFLVWTYPALYGPRYIAILWALITTFLGRMIYGDLWRGIHFMKVRLRWVLKSLLRTVRG